MFSMKVVREMNQHYTFFLKKMIASLAKQLFGLKHLKCLQRIGNGDVTQ